jgi:FtsP/CotA-like multicopper oxidase with cupredoxin domain
MHTSLSRRSFLRTTAIVGALGTAPTPIFVPARAATSPAPVRLVVERRTVTVNGKDASVFGIRQPDGSPGIVLDAGQRFSVALQNSTDEPTIIHWHGQTPPPNQDGVTETGLAPLIPAGAAQTYDFRPRPGTHWMHSHHGLQEQLLMAAPLVVRAPEDTRLDAQEVTVLLHDFTFRPPSELLAQLVGDGSHAPAMAMPGMTGGEQAGHMMQGGRSGHVMAGPPAGHEAMDLNEVDYDAYLANDRTLDDPLVVRTERNGRVRIRLINGATSTAFWIDLGAIEARVIAVDGDPVRPVTGSRFPLAQGQRIDLLLTMPAGGGTVPVLAQREGDRARTGIVLATADAAVTRISDKAEIAAAPVDLSLEERLVAQSPLTPRKVDVTHRLTLDGSMMPYVWSIDNRTWATHRPLRVARGQRVIIEMVNRSTMAHPIHLHGHHFQVVALDGRQVQGAMRDTVLVPIKGTVRIAFDADNPGRWLLHCHNLFHMARGMITEVTYETARAA